MEIMFLILRNLDGNACELMNILILTGYLYPVLGGTEIACYNIAQRLAERGNSITIVTRYSVGLKPNIIKHASKEMSLYEEKYEGRLKIYRVKRLPTMFGRYLSQTFNAYKIALKHPPDVILAFTLVPPGFSAITLKYLFMLTRFKKVPVVVWGRGSDIIVTPSRKDIIGTLTRMLLNIVSQADLILAQTPKMKEMLIGYSFEERKIKVLGNGVDFNMFKPRDIRRDNKTVIFIGGARPAKGLPYLVEAVNQMPDKRLLVIGGWGEQYWICRAIAKENIEFIDAVDPKLIPGYLNQATVFCLPSLSEGFPNSLLEAMAKGLPIVASDVGGVPYILNDAGVLVPSKNVQALKWSLSMLFNHTDIQNKYSSKALDRVKQFSWDRVIDDLEGVLCECCSR